MTEGLVFDIKRFAVHDGPGIRSTIFFKGCPLSCWWCHNPESRDEQPQRSTRRLALDGYRFDREEITGYRAAVPDLVQEVNRDRIFYEESGGGVTLSGGEPLHQPAFCEELLHALKEHGFHTALDTSGYAPARVLEKMIPYTDLFLFDLKLMDAEEHLKYTGVHNRVILDNLARLLATNHSLFIRIPVIPDITDTDQNLTKMIDFLMSVSGPSLAGISLLPFHTIARNKYRRFRMEMKWDAWNQVSPARLTRLKARFTAAGFRVTDHP